MIALVQTGKSQQCTASFNAVANQFTPNAYLFSNTSFHLVQPFGSISYTWDFGDGNGSNSTSPQHVYSGPGTYHVCLFMDVLDSGGSSLCFDSICTNIVIQNPSVFCNASFSWAASVANPNQIVFTDSSVVGGQAPGDSVLLHWSFGDGNSRLGFLGQSEVHTYVNSGGFNACLTVFVLDSLGDTSCVNVFCQNIAVAAAPLLCRSGFDYSVDFQNQRTYTFRDTSTYQSNGGAIFTDSIVWDFGDGTTGAGDSVAHSFLIAGTYNVCQTLFVISQGGIVCTDSSCQSINIPIDSGFCSIEYIVDTVNSYAGVVYVWNLGDSLNSNSTNTYMWDFGDGSFSNQPYPSHNYNLTGNYNLCLTITSVNSFSDTCVKTYCDSLIVLPNGTLGFAAGFTLNVLNPLTIGIEEFKVGEWQVYPNPASEVVHVTKSSFANSIASWTIYDLKGQKILGGTDSSKNNNIDIDVTSLTTGIYVITIEDNSSVSTQKLKIIRW